jgi:hypothetical protein
VRHPLERARNPRRHGRQRSDDVAVGQHEADEADEVRRRPVSIHVGIAKADLATGDHPPEESAIVDLDRRGQSPGGAECMSAAVEVDGQLAVGDACERREHLPFGPAIDGVAESHILSSCGGTMGTPLSRRRSACQ